MRSIRLSSTVSILVLALATVSEACTASGMMDTAKRWRDSDALREVYDVAREVASTVLTDAGWTESDKNGLHRDGIGQEGSPLETAAGTLIAESEYLFWDRPKTKEGFESMLDYYFPRGTVRMCVYPSVRYHMLGHAGEWRDYPLVGSVAPPVAAPQPITETGIEGEDETPPLPSPAPAPIIHHAG